MAEKEKTKLSLAQRTAANKQLENDLAAAGFEAEAWTVTAPKPGTGVNISKAGKQIARVTVNEAGFVKMRDYVTTIDADDLEKIADAVGAVPDRFTEKVKRYGVQKFDLSRLG